MPPGGAGEAGTKEVLYEGLSRGEKDFNALVTKIGAPAGRGLLAAPSGSGPAGAPDARAGGAGQILLRRLYRHRGAGHDAGGPQFTNGALMTFGQDPRYPPGRQSGDREVPAPAALSRKVDTLYAYASIQAIAAAWNAVGTDNAKASDWLKSHDVETVMGKQSLGWQRRPQGVRLRGLSVGRQGQISPALIGQRPEDALSF